MKLVLIGIQGAGKSTQGNLLSKQLKIPYLSTGHIFREIAKEKTQLGRYVKEIMNTGQLIPDDKTIEIVNSYISRPEYQNGYIIDGFPRTLHQAEEFKNHVDKVIYLDISQKDALWRIAFRNDTARSDETLPAIKKRIELFNKVTLPVIAYYEKKGLVANIDGTKSIEYINNDILHTFGKKLIKNQIESFEQKSKTIIAIVGLSGSGKSEAAQFFTKKSIPLVSFSNIINDYVEDHKLTQTEDVHQKLRIEFRKKYGQEAMAVLSAKKITNAFEKNNIVVIDGLYSWEEYVYLQKEFKGVRIVLVALHADKETRYERISRRSSRSKLFGKERDINELTVSNKGAPIAYADYLVKNNFSLDDLRDKLEEVYRKIYYS